MIPLDFEYVQAQTLPEAIHQYTTFVRSGMRPLYYAGGTEIITLARVHQVSADAVIDIKPIPATRVMAFHGEQLIIGAAVTLTEITDHPSIAGAFPLLQATVNEIADRTARNKITLGGNICGRIFYREAVLPLLVCDSIIRITGPKGVRVVPIGRVFRREMRLAPGEFIVQTVTDGFARAAPCVHIKRRKMGQVGYPVVTATAIRLNGDIRVAFSGVCPFPFRSSAIETVLNREGMDLRERIDTAIQVIPPNLILDDYEASREYRLFVLRTTLEDILDVLRR